MTADGIERIGIMAAVAGYGALIAGLVYLSTALALIVGGALLLALGAALVVAVNRGTE